VSLFISRLLACCNGVAPNLRIYSFDRDSFANVVDLLDDMFERCASAEEPSDMNFVKKHAEELTESGVKERTAARLFSNP
jgi:cobalamin biosynthesis Mg chelatase CobN